MALRSPVSNAAAMARASSLVAAPCTGAATPFSAAMAAATSASAVLQLAAGASLVRTFGIAQSFATELIAFTAHPWRAACRIRCANKGWSLRRFEPTTNTDCSVLRDAMDVPSQRTPSALPNSAWRSRWSMLSLPNPRTSAPARNNSSTVLCGLTSAPMLWAPCSVLTHRRPLATYSRAVCQSTSFHSPPCLSMGRVRRSGEFNAS